MKKIINILLLSCMLVLLATSCNDDAEMVFDETASERKTEAINEYQSQIESSEQGWILQYFASENQEYGGYNFIVKFDDNDSVSVWTELASDITSPEVSLYDVISYGGPVLTFNTYNLFMHFFATPSVDEYNAKGGDYEFLFMDVDTDTIHVQGTKTTNHMRLIKLNEAPEVYLEKVLYNDAFITSGAMELAVGNTEISIVNTNRNLMFTYVDEGETVSITAPYIVTDNGITLYEPVTILGNTVQDFVLDTENNRLVSGDLVINIVFPPININANLWYFELINPQTSCEAIYNAFSQAYNDNASEWGEELQTVAVMGAASPTYGDYGISFYSAVSADQQYRAHYNLDFKGVSGHEDYINIVKVGDGTNWRWYTHLEPIVDVLADNSPYQIGVNDAENPTVVQFTSVNNPEVTFIIYQPQSE